MEVTVKVEKYCTDCTECPYYEDSILMMLGEQYHSYWCTNFSNKNVELKSLTIPEWCPVKVGNITIRGE